MRHSLDKVDSGVRLSESKHDVTNGTKRTSMVTKYCVDRSLSRRRGEWLETPGVTLADMGPFQDRVFIIAANRLLVVPQIFHYELSE